MVNFDKDLEEIKTKLNNVKLSDETKNNLKIKMEEELNKPNIKEKAKNILFPRKLVATFACFVLLITSCAAFADEIESLVANIFSNTDKQVEEAIANGNYKEIDMEYVEHDGIGIKVDYIIQEDDTLCIAFNVKSEEEFDNVYFENFYVISDEKCIYKQELQNPNFKTYKKIITRNNCIFTYKIKIRENIQLLNNLNMTIENLFLSQSEKLIKKENKWTFNI